MGYYVFNFVLSWLELNVLYRYIALGLGPSSAVFCPCVLELMCTQQAMVPCRSIPLSTTATLLYIFQDTKSHCRHYPLCEVLWLQTSFHSVLGSCVVPPQDIQCDVTFTALVTWYCGWPQDWDDQPPRLCCTRFLWNSWFYQLAEGRQLMGYKCVGSLRSVPEEKESQLSCESELGAERIKNRLGSRRGDRLCGGLGLRTLRTQRLHSHSLQCWWRWVAKLESKETVVSLACLSLLQWVH